MRNQLFQEQALERLSSPEQLDRLMPLTSPRGWLALAAIGLLIAAGLAWSVLGTVETTIKAEGVIYAPGVPQVVRAPAGVKVMNIGVKVGDNVQKGDVLVTTAGPDGLDFLESPATGRVIDVADSSIVKADAPVLTIEVPETQLSAVVFVPAAEGYRVQSGMQVSLKPASEDPQSASHLMGVVRSVGRSPATQNAVMRFLQNETWTSTTLADGPVLQVNIEVPDLKPSERVFSGLPCAAQIVIERQRPMELVLPTLSQD